jgi:hypothetical protein
MTDNEILSQAFDKAIGNGWKSWTRYVPALPKKGKVEAGWPGGTRPSIRSTFDKSA